MARAALVGAALLALAGSSTRAADGETPTAAVNTYARNRELEAIALSTHRPWVWLAEKGSAKIYLAGCLHMGADPDPYYFPAYLPYYQRAAALYFEVTPGTWLNPDVATIMGRRGYSQDHRPLSLVVSQGTWQSVFTTLQSNAELLARIRMMEPWLAALTVSQEGYRRAGLQREAALESYFERKAAADRKPIGGLEKAQDQIYAMADAKRADQERSLVGSVENYGKYDGGSAPLRRAWRSGDEKTLRDAFGNTVGDDEMHSNLLPKRNQSWVKKIDAIAAAGKPALIVVGVEHLIAEPQSLVSLLRSAGYRVQRVGFAAETRQTETAGSARVVAQER